MKIETTDKIQELAPLLADCFCFVDCETPQSAYDAHAERYKKIIGTAAKYFFGHSHDSRILSMKKSGNDFFITLNDFSTLQFACALIDKKRLKRIKRPFLRFPVEIIARETTFLSLNTVGANGIIRPCQFRQPNVYLHEEIIAWDSEHVEMAFALWNGNTKRHKRHLLFLLNCERLEFMERQKISWKKFFGNAFDDYYAYFEAERNNGRYLADYTRCREFIDEIEQNMKKAGFDYTEWRKDNLWVGMTADEIIEQAAQNTKDYQPPEGVEII